MPRILVLNALPETIALLSGDAFKVVAGTRYAGSTAIANRAPGALPRRAKPIL